MPTLDCRGLACPAPVLKTRDHIERTGDATFEVRVDNDAAFQNVSRFLTGQGFSCVVTGQAPDITIVAEKTGEPTAPASDPADPTCQTPAVGRKIMVLIGADRLGRGDDDLGRGLVKNFVLTLGEIGPDLWRLVFVNSGVKLTLEGAATLEDIQALERAGVTVLVCGTCLGHFGVMDQKRVGQTTNMLDIVTSMQLADKVISI
ncbi:MAG: sulfurtransferase-like selenium metabolism protein YedF [Proteobacteria bacterium]|nr:sulfurtransferase-like selenium metabolism protein YedF [Pseudomonadota bacterium]